MNLNVGYVDTELCWKLPKAISVKPSKNYFIEKAPWLRAAELTTAHCGSICGQSFLLLFTASPGHNIMMVYNFFKLLGRLQLVL